MASIKSFSLEEPKGISTGRIKFNTGKSSSFETFLGGTDEIFNFSKDELENAKMLRDYVLNFNTNAQKDAPAQDGTVVSVVDEIRGLKGLLDEGIITQEEFDAKKTQLLAL